MMKNKLGMSIIAPTPTPDFLMLLGGHLGDSHWEKSQSKSFKSPTSEKNISIPFL